MGSDRGQAAAELVAAVPLALIAALTFAQLIVAGWALAAAGEAARAGARALHVGADPERVARHTLPAPLAEAGVTVEGQRVRVRVRAPAVVPGLPALPLSAAAALDPAARG